MSILKFAVRDIWKHASTWWLAVLGGGLGGLYVWVFGMNPMLAHFLSNNPLISNTIIIVICVFMGIFTVFFIRCIFYPVHLAMKLFQESQREIIRPLITVIFGAIVLTTACSFLMLYVIASKSSSLSFGGDPVGIYPPFSAVYAAHPELGKPLQTQSASGGAYEGFFTNAIVIWLNIPGYGYVLPEQKKGVIVYSYSFEPLKQWHEEKFVQSKLKMAPSCLPPLGSFAYQWFINKDSYNWIGCRIDHFLLDGTKIFSQRFTNGIVAGPFRTGRNQNNGGLYFVIRDDGSWDSEHTKDDAAAVVEGDT